MVDKSAETVPSSCCPQLLECAGQLDDIREKPSQSIRPVQSRFQLHRLPGELLNDCLEGVVFEYLGELKLVSSGYGAHVPCGLWPRPDTNGHVGDCLPALQFVRAARAQKIETAKRPPWSAAD